MSFSLKYGILSFTVTYGVPSNSGMSFNEKSTGSGSGIVVTTVVVVVVVVVGFEVVVAAEVVSVVVVASVSVSAIVVVVTVVATEDVLSKPESSAALSQATSSPHNATTVASEQRRDFNVLFFALISFWTSVSEKVSEMADVSPQLLSTAERGAKAIRPENLLKISKALGVSTDYLLTGDIVDKDISNTAKKISMLTPEQVRSVERIIDECISLFNKM